MPLETGGKPEHTISDVYRKFVVCFGLSAPPLSRRYWLTISSSQQTTATSQRDATSKGKAEEEGLGGQGGGGGGEQVKITDGAEVDVEQEQERRKDVEIERSANGRTRSHENILSQSQEELLRIRPSPLNACSASVCSTSSLLPIESTDFITELSALSYDYSKERSEQQLKRLRQQRNAQRIGDSCLRTSISLDYVAPNLSICSKGRREYIERKANKRHRAVRLLPPSDARQNHILHKDLNSTILVGRQILNPPKVSTFSYSLSKDFFIAEKTDRTLGLTSSYGNNVTEHKYNQLQCPPLQQQPVGKDAGEGPNGGQQQGLSGRFQMPAISKKFNTRSGMPSLSNSMPSIKVTPKPVAPCYVDPIVNCPHSFHHRITEIMALESDTIAWEKSRKLRKKIREHS